MSRTLYIIRHGNTFAPGDVVRRIGRRTDLPLVASGIAQAKALADYFISKNIEPSKIYCAPLQRTIQTAQTIAHTQHRSLDLIKMANLSEIDYGPDENKAEDDVIARIGSPALTAWNNHSTPPDGWVVDPVALIKEWQKIFDKIAKEEPRDASVFAVTSNGIARFALDAIQPDAIPYAKKLRTGAFGKVIIGDDGQAIIEQWDERP